ncbi:MAG: methionyl-tRNA formyltransferase [Coriobacteriales bacterium]|jgi:methionyl-tRNA formyltransferase|nr:methionyl-tRNA formyltransferase [Coriobacteriales bacterium]
MRITFMGTPDFAVPSLRLLAERYDVTLVVTRPDAVRSRGKRLEPSPVKVAALELGIEVLEATRVTEDVLARVRAAEPDVICVVAYGCLLPNALLEMPRLGCVNVHGSLLPRWRGAAPIQRAVLEGDERAGVSIMRLVQKMDAGAYCRQASVEVGDKGCAQIMDELSELGAMELVKALDELESGTVVWTEQDESQVTYAAKVEKAEMCLSPEDSTLVNLRRVRASTDAAPARLIVAGKGVRALEARTSDEPVATASVLVRRGHVFVGCADGTLELVSVKPDGKRAMEASAWAAGLRGADITWSRA